MEGFNDAVELLEGDHDTGGMRVGDVDIVHGDVSDDWVGGHKEAGSIVDEGHGCCFILFVGGFDGCTQGN